MSAKHSANAAKSFAFAGECMVSEAARLKTRLGKLLAETRTVALDIGRLQRIDTAGMQVIAAFVRERDRQGLTVEWRGTSATFTNAAELLGLAPLLKLPA